MLISCFKGTLSQCPNKDYSSSPKTLNYSQLIKLIWQVSEEQYPTDHIFLTNYLQKVVSPDNEQLARNYIKFQKDIHSKQYSMNRIHSLALRWLLHQLSPLETLISIWNSYLEFQIKATQETVFEFLVHEVHLFISTIQSLLKGIQPTFKREKDRASLKILILDTFSKTQFFQQIMLTYQQRYNLHKGVGGESTHSQILQTKKELQDLVNFSQIQSPFALSIKKMRQFHEEHRLIKKIRKGLQVINQIREEIVEYQKEKGLTGCVGGEQMMAVVNYVSEKTGLNILASVSYLNSWVGHSSESKQELLFQVSRQASYAITLLECAASYYCHASQIFA